jgi:hypothetical protein
MRITPLIGAIAAGALLAVPAWAQGPPTTTPNGKSNPGAAHRPASQATPTPGPNASLPAKAKAYGERCQGQSKKHVAGQKGTPFSQCVTAMAKMATGQTSSPTVACKGMSKKHVAGQKGTPFSRCVVAAAKLHAEEGAS